MKTKEQIETKLKECIENENECEWMAHSIINKTHPKDSGYEFKTFSDLDVAYGLDADVWMDKSVMFFEVGRALKWVLEDE